MVTEYRIEGVQNKVSMPRSGFGNANGPDSMHCPARTCGRLALEESRIAENQAACLIFCTARLARAESGAKASPTSLSMASPFLELSAMA